MNITLEQLYDIEAALTLAEYFVDEQDPSNDSHESDSNNLLRAQKSIAEVFKQNGVTA